MPGQKASCFMNDTRTKKNRIGGLRVFLQGMLGIVGRGCQHVKGKGSGQPAEMVTGKSQLCQCGLGKVSLAVVLDVISI